MIRFLPVLFILWSVLQAVPAAGPESKGGPPSGPGDIEESARSFVQMLSKGEFSGAVGRLDAPMAAALPEAKLRQAWEALIRQKGAFEAQTGIRVEKGPSHDLVHVTCEFEKGSMDIQLTFDRAGRVGGLFFLPAQIYEPPSYAKAGQFREEVLVVGKDEWALPGTLTIPARSGPFPAVVLVHGSGPNDRDESIGSNKPFRDLSGGLATHGIAVLRYEKRTRAHAAKCAALLDRFTIKEEVLDDALAAVSLLRSRPEVDGKRIFVLGHSLGGTLAPRLGRLDPEIRGLIVMAGAARPLEDLLLEQIPYLLSLNRTLSDAAKAKQMEEAKKQVAEVKDPHLSMGTPRDRLPLGVPAAYWLDTIARK